MKFRYYILLLLGLQLAMLGSIEGMEQMKMKQDVMYDITVHDSLPCRYKNMSRQVSRYIASNDTYKGLINITKLLDEAKQRNFEYGIYSASYDLARLNAARCESRQAIENYQTALAEYRKHPCNEDTAVIYLQMAYCYSRFWQYGKQLECANMGLRSNISNATNRFNLSATDVRNLLLQVKAHALFNLDRRAEMLEMADKWGKLPESLNNTSTNSSLMAGELYMPGKIFHELQLMTLIANGKTNEANKFVVNVKCDTLQKMGLEKIYNKYAGDIKEAYQTFSAIVSMTDSIRESEISNEIESITAKLDSGIIRMEWLRLRLNADSLGMEHDRLNMANMLLTMSKNQMELAKVRRAEQSDNIIAENNQLQSSNKHFLNEQLEDSLRKQEVEQREIETRDKAIHSILVILTIVFVLILIFTLMYIRNRMRLNAQLQHTYRKLNRYATKLQKTREKADEANMLKTRFLQNMSNDIRVPLHEIVDTTNEMAADCDGLSKDKLKNMSERIYDCSQRLTAVVSSLLGLSDDAASQNSLHESGMSSSTGARVSVCMLILFFISSFSFMSLTTPAADNDNQPTSPEVEYPCTNDWGLSDCLYDILMDGLEVQSTPQSLEIADRLLLLSDSIDNELGACYALWLKFNYWHLYHPIDHNSSEYRRAVAEMERKGYGAGKAFAIYYDFCSDYVLELIYAGKVREAYNFNKKLQEYAVSHNDYYGIYSIHFNNGSIQNFKGNKRLALDSYLNAVEYAKKHNVGANLASDYLQISDMYGSLNMQDKQLEYIQKAEDEHHPKITKVNCDVWRFFVYSENDYKEKALDIWLKLKNDSDFLNLPPDYKELATVYGLCFEKKWDEALNFINAAEDEKFRLSYLKTYWEQKEVYDSALIAAKRFLVFEDSLKQLFQTTMLMDDLQKFHIGQTQIEQDSIRLDNMRKEREISTKMADNIRLELNNSRLALDSAQSEARIASLNRTRSRLAIDNVNLKERQLKDSLAIQKALESERQSSTQYARITIFLVFGVLALLIFTAVAYLRFINRLSARLKVANKKLSDDMEALEIASAEAQKANEQKSEFIMNISHEIRTPLNSMVGFSQMFAEARDFLSTKDKADMRNAMQMNSALLDTIINDVLDITAIESGDYQMDISKVFLNAVCREAIQLVAQRKPDGVEVIFDSDISEFYEVETDRERVIQVITNMLTNAYKNTSSGSVTLSVKVINGKIQIAVADTGIGIPSDQHEAVFERFRKLDSFKQGVGLGLSICRVIAKRLGGRIFIDAGYTTGARFVFELS